MKPLHTSELSTASDSRMVVRVMEISTPDGPVRRIVVEANAEMDTTEARWLRDKLDLAITLAEEPADAPNPTMPCWCIADDPCRCTGRESIKDCPCYRLGVANHQPAVSEDQPKPRESVTYEQYAEAIRAVAKAQATSRQRHGMAHQPKTFYVGDMVKAAFDAAGIKVASVDFTALSEVPADSEQVRHG